MQLSAELKSIDVSDLVEKIDQAQNIILSTHKQCDGDGLGAMLGLFHALKKQGKNVRVISVDAIPAKYSFLEPHRHLETFEGPHAPIEATDLALIFDTNDKRLVEPLWSTLHKKCRNILFVDHHPVLNQGPEPTEGSFIETQAASTGEIAFFIIKNLGIPLDANIARALYTSIVFDTQLFRFVRNSPSSHLISAELLQHEQEPELVHSHLFANNSADKMRFLSEILAGIEYYAEGRVAVLKISSTNLSDNNLEMDDSRDVIDMIMNIQTVEVAALFRQDEPEGYKLSLRSKGQVEVLGIAENYGGGGHVYAAGAFLEGDYSQLKKEVAEKILQRVNKRSNKNGSNVGKS